MQIAEKLDYSIIKSFQEIPRRCYAYMGILGVGIWAYGHQIKDVSTRIVSKTTPMTDKTKEYMSWLIQKNQALLNRLYSSISQNKEKVLYGITTVCIGGLSVMVYQNRDSLVIIPISLMNLGKNSLLATRAKLLKE